MELLNILKKKSLSFGKVIIITQFSYHKTNERCQAYSMWKIIIKLIIFKMYSCFLISVIIYKKISIKHEYYILSFHSK